MAGRDTQAFGAALSVDGTADGYAEFTSTAGFQLGAVVWISSSAVEGIECIVVEKTATLLGLRLKSSQGYGRTDLSNYLVGDGARVDQPEQFVAQKPGTSSASALTEASGDLLALGQIADTQFLKRVGDMIVGATAGGSGVDTMAAVGAVPNANAASISGTTLTLQPASGSFPGVVTTAAQTFGGTKTFNTIVATTASATTLSVSNLLAPLAIGGITASQLPSPVNASFSTATTGGTLPSSTTFYYRVSATNDQGETPASTQTSQATGASTETNTVTVNWNQIVGATGYKVYGRTTGAEQLIATIGSGSTTTYIDDGSVTPAGALPAANTTGNLVVNRGSFKNTAVGGYSPLYPFAGGVYDVDLAELSGIRIGTSTLYGYLGAWNFGGSVRTESAFQLSGAASYWNASGITAANSSNGTHLEQQQAQVTNITSANVGAAADAIVVGTKVADGSVDATANLFSVRTGVGGTPVSKFTVHGDGSASLAGALSGPDTWHVIGALGEPAYQNSWVEDTNYQSTRFKKNALGRVQLQMNVKTPSASPASVIFTLPVGYRPAVDMICTSGNASGITYVKIGANGNVESVFSTSGQGYNVPLFIDFDLD